jgi:hypothetical protein
VTRKLRGMNTTPYEITVRGRLGDTLTGAFPGLAVAPAGANTVLRGSIDQAALHGVLERIESLGLELLDVRRR